MDTFTATDTLSIIDYGNSVLIVCNRVHRTRKLTWSLQMGDCIVRAGSCTLTTLFTLLRINVGTVASGLNRAELTSINTCLTHTVLAVLGYCIT